MTSPFSWSDTVKIAFNSCLPCLNPDADDNEHEDQPHNSAINRIPRARPDELQGLLVDDDTDADVETMSLHSNMGRARRKKKQKRTKKHNNPRRITFFGYNLFGRPPVQLPDEDDALHVGGNGDLTPVTAHSTATFDSDAAPLDSDTIAALSSSNVAATAAQASGDIEAQILKEKEERRQRRRKKRELRRLAESMAAQSIVGDGDEFEGFQGSGGFMAPPLRKGYPHVIDAISPASDSGSGSAFSGSAQEYGQFVVPQAPFILQPEDNPDDADLDGGVYAHQSHRSRGSHGGSDSRSRTSMSTSDRGLHQVPFNPTNVHAKMQAPSLQAQPSRKKKSSRTTATTNSSTTSHSPSLPSPISLAFSNGIVSPSTVEQGQGFFDAEDPVRPCITNDVKKPVEEFLTPKLKGGEFPMTGFRGLSGVGAKRTGDFGAFLARRGDEDDNSGL